MTDLYPLLSLYTGSAGVALSVAVGSWRQRRRTSAAVPLSVLMGGLTWWACAVGLQSALPTGLGRVIASYAIYPGVAAVVAGFYCEARTLTDRDWRPGRGTLALLAVHPVLLLVVIGTDRWHHLLIARLQAPDDRPWPVWSPGPLFWVHTGYCYLMLGWCFLHLARMARSSGSPLQRRQLRSVVLAGLIPTAANVVAMAGFQHDASPEITSCFFVVTGVIVYYAVFKQGLLRLVPVARGLVMEHVSDAIYVVDTAGLVVDLNPAGLRLARRLRPELPEDLVGCPAWVLTPQHGPDQMPADGEYHLPLPDGGIDLDLRISELSDKHGRALGEVLVVRDVTELNAQRRELAAVNLQLAAVNDQLVEQLSTIDRLRRDLAEQAVRDELTGLHNRRYLIGQLERELDRARDEEAWLSVILLDIDRFKAVNDRFGHAVGDHLLTATAKALLTCVQGADTVARYGGEEFVVLLPDATLEDALDTAEELRRCCGSVLIESRRGPVSTTVSAGVASFPLCGWTGSDLLQAADEALYAAKAAGRDRVISAVV